MQITDMLNQYNRNIAGGVEISGGTQGIKEIVSSLQELAVGNVFEGNVNHIENGVVTLGLPDGKTIQAKLDTGVTVNVGQSMFFQVKSNNGTQIAIRPFSNGTIGNPTLLNALEAANLQVNGKTLTMVNAMMEQSMSIDKQSLTAMARLVMNNENIDVRSIVQMAKLGIPITEEMAAQFENYKSDQYAILDQLESVITELPEQLSSGRMTTNQLLDINRQITEVLLNQNPAEQTEASAAAQETVSGENMVQTNTEKITINFGENGENQTAQAVVTETAAEMQTEFAENLQAKDASAAGGAQAEQSENTASTKNHEAAQVSGAQKQITGQNVSAGTALTEIFSEKELMQLSAKLGRIPEFSENPALFSDGKLNNNLTSKELLQFIQEAFSHSDSLSKPGLADFVSSKAYRTLLRNVMEQQWLLRPEDLKTEHKVGELYERLDRQMEQIEKILKNFGQNTTQLSDTASGVRSNIQFMNQLNQTYAYVQIPLKLAGQNAHSDLYVYTDKKKRNDPDAELTAFLHLDMEHLGSTDVSIRMHQKKVTTNFYLSDDDSYQLLLEHLDILEERLEKKGYNAKIQVINQEKKGNFVEDLLNKGKASPGGMVHRYSFDVRA